jgi:rhodanese-related sulfurtransferase
MPDSGKEALRGVVGILTCGLLLGLAYNWFGLISDQTWGLSWIAEDKLSAFAESEMVSADETGGDDDYWTDIDDPLAVPASATVDLGLPEIPDVGRPVQIELQALKQYFDAEAALIVDARDPEDYEEAHISGALNIPYDIAESDPALLENLVASCKPIITYCGGGSCEVSLTVANELVFAGYSRVAVYTGGFSEWAEAGYPVDRSQP